MVHPTGQPIRFNKVSDHVANLETCAAQLEALRIKFIQLGGSHLNIAGVYQGQFIFVRHEGVFTSTDLDGMTYLALVRTGDGRLAVPGAHQTAQ